MTLRRKIISLISVLTLLIILAMSGCYYYLFSKQTRENSRNQVRLAFKMVFDDMKTRGETSRFQVEEFIRTSLTGPMYMVKLLQEQFQSQEEWTVKEVKKLGVQLNGMNNELSKFGSVIEASDILIYDSTRNLLAVYMQKGDEKVVGGYIGRVLPEYLIPFQPGDDWFALLKTMEEIPRLALPNGIPKTYQEEFPETASVRLRQYRGKIMIQIIFPVLQGTDRGGIVVVYLAARQMDTERYSRLSDTKINMFAGKLRSVGTLPAYSMLSDAITSTRHVIDILHLPESLPIAFSESDVGGQHYQGTIALGNAQELIGAITVHFPRALEEQRLKQLWMFVGIITVVFIAISTAGAIVLSLLIAGPIKRMTQLLQQLTQGDLTGMTDQTSHTLAHRVMQSSNDELVLLMQSFRDMVAYLRDMANAADHISRGEILQTIAPRSEKDVLGNAFHHMTTYLKTIASVATAFADGDLRREITPQTDADVLGQAFRKLSSLRETMRVIMEQAEHLKTMSAELTQISVQMVTDASQAAHRVSDISTSGQDVSENVAEVAGAMGEMSANIREISRNTDDVAKVVNKAVNTAISANTTIGELEKRSLEIGKIIKVITSITQQTNLLALNATIEAARAGDMGRGFAIVASEVKDLAREVAKSAEDITRKIGAIQTSSQAATSAITAMSQDINLVHNFSEVIVTAITEQSTVTESITHNLTEASQKTEEVTNAIADVATVVQNSSDMAVKVNQSAEKQASMAEELRQMVRKFKI